MAKVEKMEYDENPVKMYGPVEVIKETIAKMNEIIDVVNPPKSKGKKEKETQAGAKGSERG